MKPWEQYAQPKPWEKFAPNPQELPAETQEPQEGLGRTILDQGLQGATFGFADEVTDRLGAAGASLLTDQSYGDLLNEARGLTTERQQRQFEQRPGASIAANIAGGLGTGIAGATTKAGAAIGNLVRSGNTAARVGKGAIAGAASGGLYGAGIGEDGERLSSAGQGAVLGGIGGAAVPAIGSALSKANTRVIVPNSDKVREQASKLYKVAEQKGGVLKADFTNNFVDEVESMVPQTDIGKIFGGNSPFSQAARRISKFRDKPVTLEAAQEFDELLSEAIDGFVDKTTGRLDKQGNKLLSVQSKFRNMIESADDSMIEGGREGFEAIKDARKLWATSRRLYDVEKVINNAENYQVPATAIKTGFRNMLKNPSKLRGYSPSEVKAIEKAAQTGVVTDLLSVFGSRLGPIAAGAGGFAAAGPVGGAASALASYAGSTASRAAATGIQTGKAKKVAEQVAKNAGLSKTEKRVQLGRLREIMKLPPNEARLALEKFDQVR